MESDAIGLQGGFNTHGYVAQNPLLYNDPLGLLLCGIWGDLAIDWATGLGSRNRFYGQGSAQVDDVRGLPPVRRASSIKRRTQRNCRRAIVAIRQSCNR